LDTKSAPKIDMKRVKKKEVLGLLDVVCFYNVYNTAEEKNAH